MSVLKTKKSSDALIPLSNAEIGKEYVVETIVCKGMIRRRILDMGIVPGSVMKVLRAAPLGDPIEVVTKGLPLSIRRAEASCVLVKEVMKN